MRFCIGISDLLALDLQEYLNKILPTHIEVCLKAWRLKACLEVLRRQALRFSVACGATLTYLKL